MLQSVVTTKSICVWDQHTGCLLSIHDYITSDDRSLILSFYNFRAALRQCSKNAKCLFAVRVVVVNTSTDGQPQIIILLILTLKPEWCE